MVGLNSREVELFKLFRENQAKFETLIDSGFFNVRAGAAIVHFDSEGNIRKTEVPIIKIYTVKFHK